MQDIEGLLQDYRRDIDRYLEELLEDQQIYSELKEAMTYSLLSGGKRIRPILTLLTCQLLEGNEGAARRVGAALEFIHTYSLIHDDLPAMDDDDFRRGQRSNHLVFGEGMAILAGDALLTQAFQLLVEVDLPAEKRCRLVNLIAESAGIQGMVAGQAMDLRAENRKIELEELQQIHQKKTGALFRAAILSGVLCSDYSREEWQALETYAEKLGLTFQIVDDLLDVVGNSLELGKEVGQDLRRGKATYPALLGLEESRRRAEKAASQARESLAIFAERAGSLRELVDFVLERSS